MTSTELLNRLAQVLQTTPDRLTLDAGPSTLQGWDSMGSLGIISLLDDEGIHDITAEDASKFTTIGDIVSFARARGVLKD
jgi:acyl carrier protein